MSKKSKTFRLEEDLVAILDSQSTAQARSTSNVVHGYLEERTALGGLWPAFDLETLGQVKDWLEIPKEERAQILAKRRKK